MKQSGERTLWKSKGSVPFMEELEANYREWVPEVKELWDIDRRLAELNDIEQELRAKPRTPAAVVEQLRQCHERYRERYLKSLGRLLTDEVRKNSPDPLARLERLDIGNRAIVPIDDILEAHARFVPQSAHGPASEAEREKALKSLDIEKRKLKTRAAELRHPPYLRLHAGAVEDVRLVYIESWRGKQREAREATDARGFDLRECDPDTQWAYGELGIASAIGKGSNALRAATMKA